jgi:Protein kinase domain
MGVVWRGHDRTTGTVYAIKVVRPEYARDPMAVGRFVRERTAMVALRHPNVVTVHDMIVEGEQLALVMDMVSGGDLGELRMARGGRLAPAEAAFLTAQVGDGLAAAHAAGIVHRDLKPANVLLTTDRVLLADFGIAVLSDQTRMTSTGGILGTPAYLPPEVISGHEPGPAGDVYALGITLYELVAGQPPFTGNTAAVLHAHGSAAPQRDPAIPDALWEIISYCLAKDPASRPSAAEVAGALHGFAAAPAGPVTALSLHGFAEAPVGPANTSGRHGFADAAVGPVTASGRYGFADTPAGPVTAPAFPPRWPREPQMRPDTVQAVQQAPGTAERPPLAGGPPRATPANRRRTTIIAAASAAAVVLLAIGAITLNPFGASPSASQARLAGSGATLSQSAPAVTGQVGQSSRAAGSRASGTSTSGTSAAAAGASGASGATGPQTSSSSQAGTGTGGNAGASAPSGSAGSGSTPSPATNPVSSSASSASGSTVTDADGFPILHASTGQQAHSCAIIGSAADSTINQTVEGVVCADVITSAGSGGYAVQGQLELYCQTVAAADVQCADVIAQGELANGLNGVVASTGSYQCGHSYGACATGRNYVKTGSYSYSGLTMANCSSNGASITDVWGLALGNSDTEIELPGSDKWVSLSASNANDSPDQSTGHQYVCP